MMIPRVEGAGGALGSRVALCVLLLLLGGGGPFACALGPERDTSFLVPGRTQYSEVKTKWDDTLPDFAGPEESWDEEMFKEKPQVTFIGRGMSLLPLEATPEDARMTLVVSSAERKKWTKVTVRVFEYRRYLCSTAVGDPAGATRIHLVFTKDAKGAPDQLWYFRVGLREDELKWEEIVRRNGQPEDLEYSYVGHWDGVLDAKSRFILRRHSALGVGYVWHASRAEELCPDPEKARKQFFDSRIHFAPEPK